MEKQNEKLKFNATHNTEISTLKSVIVKKKQKIAQLKTKRKEALTENEELLKALNKMH